MPAVFQVTRFRRSIEQTDSHALFNRQHFRGSQSCGFSMIEIMIGIAIIGIVMAVAVPNLNNTLKNGRVTAVSNELLASLNFARSEAIKRRVNVAICNTPDGTDLTDPDIADCDDGGTSWEDGWIVHVNDDDTPDYTILQVKGALGDNLDVQTNLESTDLFEFNNRGFVFGDNNFLFAICDDRGPENGRLLQIERTGRSRVVVFDDPDATDCSVSD